MWVTSSEDTCEWQLQLIQGWHKPVWKSSLTWKWNITEPWENVRIVKQITYLPSFLSNPNEFIQWFFFKFLYSCFIYNCLCIIWDWTLKQDRVYGSTTIPNKKECLCILRCSYAFERVWIHEVQICHFQSINGCSHMYGVSPQKRCTQAF